MLSGSHHVPGYRTILTPFVTWLVLAGIVLGVRAPVGSCSGQETLPSGCETTRACCCHAPSEPASCCCRREQEPPVPTPAADGPARNAVWLLSSAANAGMVEDPLMTDGPTGSIPGVSYSCTRSVQSLFCVWQN
jgi:hypothetical protein